jgi:hypothetical protein
MVPTKEVNWEWMATKNLIFDKIKAACDELEMTQMMSFKYDWNEEIIYQFYATFYYDVAGQKLIWMTTGQWYKCTVCQFVWMLGLEHQLTMELEAQIHTYNMLKLEEMQFMYTSGAKAHPPKIQNFLLELLTLHCLLRATLTPRIGDATTYPQFERNLIQFYVQKKPFLVFESILQEIISISRTALHSCGYAPQIMMMIEKVSKIEFLKDHEMTDLKPQFPNEPIISMDVPSPSTGPRSTRSGAVAPSPDVSPSSSGGVLRVLKSMFAWCCDTRQC